MMFIQTSLQLSVEKVCYDIMEKQKKWKYQIEQKRFLQKLSLGMYKNLSNAISMDQNILTLPSFNIQM